MTDELLGTGEHVIFRELFVQGLTLLDLRESGTQLSMSHVAAREEVRALLETIAIPGLAARRLHRHPPTAPHPVPLPASAGRGDGSAGSGPGVPSPRGAGRGTG